MLLSDVTRGFSRSERGGDFLFFGAQVELGLKRRRKKKRINEKRVRENLAVMEGGKGNKVKPEKE